MRHAEGTGYPPCNRGKTGATEVRQSLRSPSQSGQERLPGPAHLRPATVSPVDVGRDQPDVAGVRRRGRARARGMKFSGDESLLGHGPWLADRSTDVLVMDDSVGRGGAAEQCGDAAGNGMSRRYTSCVLLYRRLSSTPAWLQRVNANLDRANSATKAAQPSSS